MEGKNFPKGNFNLKQKYFAICLGLCFRRLFIIAFQVILTVFIISVKHYYKVIIISCISNILFEYIVQDDSGSDDSEVANPVERERHGDANNYNSSEEDGSDIITVASDNEENIGDQHLGIRMSQVITIALFTL